jgi:large subunit ribosomal protein L13
LKTRRLSLQKPEAVVAFVQKNTHFFKQDEIDQKWYVVDAAGQTLGRLASQVAHVLRGKHKPLFTPNVDAGDFVVVINAEKVKVTGKRTEMKEYFHYTGYPGGAVFERYRDLIKKNPQRVIEHAVKGMLPHNRLGRRIIRKLKVYAGSKHPHAAQKPEVLAAAK